LDSIDPSDLHGGLLALSELAQAYSASDIDDREIRVQEVRNLNKDCQHIDKGENIKIPDIQLLEENSV
jgi:hypothetical protein